MAVSAVGSSMSLTSALQNKGLTADKAQLVQKEVVQSVAASTDLGGMVDGEQVRAKLDKRLSADVKSGKLTEEDAAAVTKLLDETDEIEVDGADVTVADTGEAKGSSPAGGAKGAGPGGGGGGGSTEKTELSRTVDIVGSIKTTTIKYTDGTSETKSAFTTDKSPKDKVADKDANAKSWLANIEPGSLVDKLA